MTLTKLPHVAICLAVAGAIGVPLTAVNAQRETAPATQLAAAQKAVRTGPRAPRLEAFSLRGTVRHVNIRTGVLGPEEAFELRVSLPDRYVRIEKGPLLLRQEGYRGTEVLNRWVPQQKTVTFISNVASNQLEIERLKCARLALGIFAETRTGLDIQAASADRRGGSIVLRMSGRDGFASDLELNAQTLLPERIAYDGEVPFPRSKSAQEQEKGPPQMAIMPPAEKARIVLHFDDRLPAGGFVVPRRIRKVSKDILFEEVVIAEAKINPAFADADFKK
jgi:hypothetical protein